MLHFELKGFKSQQSYILLQLIKTLWGFVIEFL